MYASPFFLSRSLPILSAAFSPFALRPDLTHAISFNTINRCIVIHAVERGAINAVRVPPGARLVEWSFRANLHFSFGWLRTKNVSEQNEWDTDWWLSRCSNEIRQRMDSSPSSLAEIFASRCGTDDIEPITSHSVGDFRAKRAHWRIHLQPKWTRRADWLSKCNYISTMRLAQCISSRRCIWSSSH